MVKGMDISKVVLYGGVIILAYYVLKSWGIIQPMSSVKSYTLANTNDISTWKPLSDTEIQNIRSIIDYNQIELVKRT